MKNTSAKSEDISCQEAMKLIAQYVDSHLKGKPSRSLEKHIEKCRHCFDRVEFEKLLKSRLRRLQVRSEPEQMRKKIDSLFESL